MLIDTSVQKQVCLAIQNLGYSKRLQGHSPTSIAGKIVSDADMCDGLGTHGIIRTYTYGLKAGRPFFDRAVFPNINLTAQQYKSEKVGSSICHIFEKVLKLKDLMLTDAGRAEAARRHQIVVDFLYHFFDEEDAPE